MNLYDIDKAILSCIDLETGEIVDFDALEKLQMERDEKIENILLWIKNLDSDAAQIRAEEKSLAERRHAMEKKAEGLREYVQDALDGQKFQTARVSVSYRRSNAVVVDDVSKVPSEFLTYKDPELDKTKAKAALKAGEIVDGCHLEERMNMSIK